jgi:hypothetical protein
LDVSALLKEADTVPFVGFSSAGQYPEAINPLDERFDVDEARSFKEAISVLPEAGEETLWAENEFVSPAGDGSVSVAVDKLRDVDGIDIGEVEKVAGASVEELVKSVEPGELSKVTEYKGIIDRRRLALATLGFETRFRWQIASDQYEAGEIQTFLSRKVAAAQKQGCDDAFGWIRHHDWGGEVQITTIYPSLKQEIGMPDDVELDSLHSRLTVSDGGADSVFADRNQSGGDDTGPIEVYFGDKLGYDFRGTQTVHAYPVIYAPAVNAMIPLPEPRFSRRHVGDWMDEAHERNNGRRSPVEWHENILSQLEGLTGSISKDVMRSRIIALDFDELPFTIEDFYGYLGIPDKYASEASERAASLASPATEPSLWNLQLSLKLALLDHFEGAKGGDSYQQYQEVAGQLLVSPAQQVQIALTGYENDQDEDDEEGELVDVDQMTLGESLDDILDLPGVSEEDLELTDSERINARVQQRLGEAASSEADD